MQTADPSQKPRHSCFIAPWEYVTHAETDSRDTLHVWKCQHREGYTAWALTHQPDAGGHSNFVEPEGTGHFTSFNALLHRGGIITDYRAPDYVDYHHYKNFDVNVESSLGLAASIAGRPVSVGLGQEILRQETLHKGGQDTDLISSYEVLKSVGDGSLDCVRPAISALPAASKNCTVVSVAAKTVGM